VTYLCRHRRKAYGVALIHSQSGTRVRWRLAPHSGQFTYGEHPVAVVLERGYASRRVSRKTRKISSPPGSDLQTVQPVASHYIDCAIPAAIVNCRHINTQENFNTIRLRVLEV
jgi:hypothetical protein